ncbi:hypothetical protein D3C81_1474280 [compost metagenome]
MQRQQRQLQVQLAGIEALSTQAFPGIDQQLVLDQLWVGFADVDGADQFFQAGRRQPRRRGLTVVVLHGFVPQRQAGEVLQCKVGERHFQGLCLAGHDDRAEHNQAGNADFDVRQFQ